MVMLVQGRQSRCLRVPHLVLLLFSPLCSCHHGICSRLVGRMIQKRTDIMNKKRVQQFCDLLLVRKIQCALERNPVNWLVIRPSPTTLFQSSPNAFQVHGSNFDHMSHFFTLENAVSSPSGHSCYIQKLCAINHVIVCNCQSVRFESKWKMPTNPLFEQHKLPLPRLENTSCLHLPTGSQ